MRLAFIPALFVALQACSSSEQPSVGGSGGSGTATGSQPGSGGNIEGGGGNGSGGATASGGLGANTGDGGGEASGGASTSGDGDGSGGARPDENKITYVYVGSGAYNGDNGLISVYTFDRTTKALTFMSDHQAGGLASSIAIDSENGRLYAGDESKMGVNSFTIDKTTGRLTSLGATSAANAPVHLSLTPNRDFLLAANYNQHNVDVYPIAQNGKAESSLGATPTGNNAHCVLIDSENHVVVANKGGNTISHFNFADGALAAANPPTTTLESPRHIARRGNKAYVVSESADVITAYTVETNGAYTMAWATERLNGGNPNNDTGAEIQVTPSGKYLYASNRGSANSIVAYDITGAAPVYLEHEPTQGTTPRNFEMDPLEEVIIVANQDSGSLVVFDIEADGKLAHASTLDVSYSPFVVVIAQF